MLDVQQLREGARLARKLAMTERGWSRERLIEIALEYEAAAEVSAKVDRRPAEIDDRAGAQPDRRD